MIPTNNCTRRYGFPWLGSSPSCTAIVSATAAGGPITNQKMPSAVPSLCSPIIPAASGAAAARNIPENNPTATAKKYVSPSESAKIQTTSGKMPEAIEATNVTLIRPSLSLTRPATGLPSACPRLSSALARLPCSCVGPMATT